MMEALCKECSFDIDISDRGFVDACSTYTLEHWSIRKSLAVIYLLR